MTLHGQARTYLIKGTQTILTAIDAMMLKILYDTLEHEKNPMHVCL